MSQHAPPTGKFTAADFRDRLDNGRKVAIQILRILRPARVHHPPPGSAPHQSGARSSSFAPKAAQAGKRRSPAPGGATGLQIRVGPSDGLRWVRLPSSSATRLTRPHDDANCNVSA